MPLLIACARSLLTVGALRLRSECRVKDAIGAYWLLSSLTWTVCSACFGAFVRGKEIFFRTPKFAGGKEKTFKRLRSISAELGIGVLLAILGGMCGVIGSATTESVILLLSCVFQASTYLSTIVFLIISKPISSSACMSEYPKACSDECIWQSIWHITLSLMRPTMSTPNNNLPEASRSGCRGVQLWREAAFFKLRHCPGQPPTAFSRSSVTIRRRPSSARWVDVVWSCSGANTGVCTGARDGAMAQVHVLTGPERRRRFSVEEKRAIVAAAFAPGAVVSNVARRAGICPLPLPTRSPPR